jgi:competence CoiA-like predicted nuclease
MKLPDKIKSVLPGIVRRTLIVGSLFFLIICSLLAVGNSLASEVTVISNIQEWQHPVKDILHKHKVIINKVELHNKTYSIFYVKFPYDPRLAHNDKYFKPLYYETLKANGFWNYSFIDRSFLCKINITWDKKSRTLTESLDDID